MFQLYWLDFIGETEIVASCSAHYKTAVYPKYRPVCCIWCTVQQGLDPTVCCTYRVALNKTLHQTICNISTTSGPIINIFEAA